MTHGAHEWICKATYKCHHVLSCCLALGGANASEESLPNATQFWLLLASVFKCRISSCLTAFLQYEQQLDQSFSGSGIFIGSNLHFLLRGKARNSCRISPLFRLPNLPKVKKVSTWRTSPYGKRSPKLSNSSKAKKHDVNAGNKSTLYHPCGLYFDWTWR